VAPLLAGACGWFDDPAPDRARVVVEGEAGKEVRLIISTQFVASVNDQGQTRVVLFQADTVIVTLPFETVYTIEEDHQFFSETARLEADLQNVRVQIYLDHRKEFDAGGPLLPDQPYRFVYTFNRATTRDIVVL
jgi:hypothetical protein